MNRLVIYSVPNAYFQVIPEQQTEGIFIVSRTFNEIFCEWMPKEQITISGQNYSPESFHVAWRLCEVVEIVKEIISLEAASLRFLFEDSSQLPLITFRSNIALASLKNLFQFFKSKAIIEKPETNHYYINLRFYERKLPKNNFIKHAEIVYISEHLKIMQNLHPEILIHNNSLNFSDAKRALNNIGQLKSSIIKQGLSEESRWFTWLYLLGLYSPTKSYDENIASIDNNKYIYKSIQNSWNNILEIQKKNVEAVYKLPVDVMKDVLRTDRNLEQFAGNENPNLSVLNNVLIAYAIYCKDTGFVQGMADIVALFIIIYLKEWKGSQCTLVDGRKVDKESAEDLIFQLLCRFMSVTQHDRMFTDLLKQQEFAFERVFGIITEVHPQLAEWLQVNNLQNLLFLYRHIILLFKREFPLPGVLRLWDSILAHEKPYVFIRYFCAAIMIMAFPDLIVKTDGLIEDVMNFMDDFIRKIDVEQAIGLAIALYERNHTSFVSEPLITNSQYMNFKSSFLKFAEN